MKYMAVETVRAIAAERHVSLKAGEEIDLTDEEARALARVGYIIYTPPADPPADEINLPVAGHPEITLPAAAKKARRRPGAGP